MFLALHEVGVTTKIILARVKTGIQPLKCYSNIHYIMTDWISKAFKIEVVY